MAHICAKVAGRRAATLALLLAGLGALTGAAATGKSAAFPVDLREGDRVSAGTEELTFSNLWDGDKEATVTIAQDGAAIFTGLSGEGVKTWSVDRNGRYVLTHTTYTNGVKGKVETAVFVVEGKEVPVGELTVAWEAGSFMYDNTGKTPGVTAKNGDKVLEKGVDYTVHYEGNTNAGTAKAILTGLPPYVGSVTNEFAIAKRLVELTSGTDSKAYDGTPLVCHSVTTNGDGFVAGEGVDFSFTGSQTVVGSSKNTFDYTFKAGTSAGNYTITKTEGNLTVNAATIYDEPGPGPVPVGGLSKFDATYVYDGEGHTINTQALYAVTLVGSTPSFSFSLDGETGWQNDPFVYTNSGEYVVWYKITAPNYEDYMHQAKVTIQPLVLTVTFDANGGSCPMASKTVTHGATYGTLPTPTWTGHIFAGWYTAASGGDEVKDSTAVSIMAPQTLYAHWVSVTGVSAKQRYPWNGLVDITVAFEGESNDVAKVDCSFIATNSATKAALSVASITRKRADSGKDNAWSRQFVWNAGADVGAVKIDDVAFTVVAGMALGGVQLWENGPYWAECNVGATKPEEYGYYFWWGDTVGYKRVGGRWDAVDGSCVGFSFSSENCPIYGKDDTSLRAEGYIDSAGNLVAAHDAAVMHFGAPWRMPTHSEFEALVGNCDHEWVAYNGKYGWIVKGRGALYRSKSIFLPASGGGYASAWYNATLEGDYWSSTLSRYAGNAYYLNFNSSLFSTAALTFYDGRSVRPLREAADVSAAETVMAHLSLDCRTGDRVSAGTEELTFSNLWDGDAEATVTIAQDGAAIFTGLSGEGEKTWAVDRNGRYVLTHTTYTNGAPGKVETAVFVVEGKEVPVSELTIDWGQSSFAYDGQPKEPVITVKDRGTTLTKGTHYLVEYKDNINVGTAKAIVKGIEPYVEEVTNAFTITKGSLPDDVDPDPIKPDPTKPDEPYSAFDYVGVYDGEGHTIDTNGLAVAYRAAVGAGFAVSYAVGESGGFIETALPPTDEGAWSAVAPVFTNAATNVVWYKVSSANYEDIVHPAKVAIVPRAITIASVDGTWTYDTVAHGTNEVEIVEKVEGVETEFEFPEGEGIEVDEASFPTITDVGEKDNTFEWAFAEGTLAGNYAVTVKYGKLKVNARTIGDDDKNWDIRLDKAPMYNGEVQSAPIIQVCYVKPDGNLDYIPYELAGNTATDAGNYKVKISGKGNYSGTVEKDWAIMPRNLKMTSGTEEWMYDGITHSNDTVTVTGDGFVEGEGATYEGFPLVTHFADAAEPVENAFTYKLNDNTKAKNYEIVTEKGKVAMTRRPISLTAPTKSKTYDGKALTFTAAEIVESYSGSGGQGLPALPDGENFVYSNFASITEAGQVAATFSIADGTALMDDYDITVTPGATLTVTRAAEITVTAKSKSWTYDGKSHELHEYDATNLGTLVGGDKLEVTFSADSVVTTPIDGENQDGVVENTIISVKVMRGDVDVSDNYTLAWYPGALTVTKRPVTVTVEGETVSATYDGEEHTASGYDIATEDELYDIAAKTTFGGTDEVTRTDAGKSEMGLKPSDFTNSDEYFDVTYAVTDGWVSVVPADISAGEEDFVLTLGANPKYNGTVQTIPVTAVTYRDLPVTYTLAGENATHAGTYTLTVKANGNFKGERSTTWKILKRQVKMTSGSASRAYNGQPLVNGDVTVSGDGFIGVEGATYSVTGSQTLAGSSKNAFTYALKAGTQEGDYDIEKVEGDLVVTKAKYPGNIQWNVAADAATWMYDGQQHGVTLTGVPSGVTPHLTGNVAKDVGEYTASVTFDFDAANYEPPKVPAPLKWSITARPLSLQTVNAEKPYDGFPLTVDKANITPGLSGYAEGECFDYFDLASITEVGETPATFKYRDSASAKVSNYAVSVVGGATLKVTVGGDQISVTARDGTWAYDATEHRKMEWDIVNGDKLLAGHEFRIKIDETKSVVKTPEDGPEHNGIVSNVFEYVKIVETETGADKTKNYNLFVKEGALQITNRVICSEELRVNSEEFTEKIEKTYDGEPTNVTVTAELLQPATILYAVGGDVPGAPQTGWQEEPPEFTDAGEYVVWYTVAAQYYNTYTNKVEVKINPRPVTLLSGSATKTYDGTPLRKDEVKVKAGSLDFVEGEGVTATCTSAQTGVGRIENGFNYEFKSGTLQDNYTIIPAFGWLEVTPGTLTVDPAKSGYNAPYDGKAHGPEVLAALSGLGFNPEACEITYALVPGDESAYSPTMPTLTDVGTQTVYVKIKAQNFEVVYAEMTVVVTEKEITDEMVQPGEDAFFFDGDAKKPTVDVQHIVDGVDICTENDYTVTYGTKADAGWWVTVTGKGNYSGTVTKIVPVLKRPVAPPVVPSRSYNGKTQKPTIPTDSRWTTVSNPGGIDVGEYSNVVLRLTNTTDYKWKGGAEDQTDITLVFKVTKGNNGWSRYPGMTGWTYGETPNEPVMGQARYGTVQVAYRRKGADVSTETATKPSTPGTYIARFWVDETENHIGVALSTPYEVEFEIAPGAGGFTETQTTPVPVPYVWLEKYLVKYGKGDYETAGNAKGANGVSLWESYVAGLDPEDATSRFMAKIEMLPNGTVKITWSPDLSTAEVPRTYTMLGKAKLTDADWTPVTDANKSQMRFFKVKVEMK